MSARPEPGTPVRARRPRDVRFVGDLTVNGEVRLSGGDATARLTVAGGDGGSRAWKPFLTEDDTAVSGTFAGRGFTTTIPSR
ncbi:hypothetical protein [Streptosporangium sp. NPDC006930]|uniref:hypothetical protein n=1 Tax=unclassified Streptosporangium TaxID=2632669 RepID=UPI00342365CB